MVTFYKNANCPSSQDLLAFQNEETSNETGKVIKKHIELCEFCEAEVGFYGYYPQTEEKVMMVEIPPPLYELAEALLKNNTENYSALEKLIGKTGKLELKEV